MKKLFLLLIVLFLMTGLTACQAEGAVSSSHSASDLPAATDAPPNASSAPLRRVAPPSMSDAEDIGVQISVQSSEYTVTFALNESTAAEALCGQLPLEVEVEPYSDNEIIFYPPRQLDAADTPLAAGGPGTLAYYEPWGNVVMFYGDYSRNSSLYELGQAVSGAEHIGDMSGTVTIEQLE